jgi:hypothetical protein
VIGSQSILGSYPEEALPPEATGSMEPERPELECRPQLSIGCCHRRERCVGGVLEITVSR